MQKHLLEFLRPRSAFPFFELDFLALIKGIKIVIFYFFYRIVAAKPGTAFKVKIKASVIDVYRAYGCYGIIRYEYL